MTFTPLTDEEPPQAALDAMAALAPLLAPGAALGEMSGTDADDRVLFRVGVVEVGDLMIGYHVDLSADGKVTFAVGEP